MSSKLEDLVCQLPEEDDRALRHIWFKSVVDWIRGNDAPVSDVLSRVDHLVEFFANHAQARQGLQKLWLQLDEDLELASLLAELGIASRGMFLGEFGRRLLVKALPQSPASGNSSDFFMLVFHQPSDVIWIRALSTLQLRRLADLLMPLGEQAALPDGDHALHIDRYSWQALVLRALSHCISQIAAAGFQADLRQRMSLQARSTDCFARLGSTFHDLVAALQTGQGIVDLVEELRYLLVEAQWAGVSVYEHLEANGISIEVVYQLRQLRQRVERTHALLDLLASERSERLAAGFVAQLITLAGMGNSIRTLLSSSTHILAARLAERTAESGDHYITRDATQYRRMLGNAAGGGALLGFTTWIKLLLGGLSVSLFWAGAAIGLNYALAFVIIYLLHFTVATKQPAMTAPAMVARLRILEKPADLFRFVDEIAHLIRSQMGSIAGNLGAVVPTVAILSLGLIALGQPGMVSPAKAHVLIEQHQIFGPSLMFAVVTGVLLFISSITGGWAENWFVLHQLDSALAYSPKVQARLGTERANRLGRWLRNHVSGLVANISLGLMLGLVPVCFQFFGIPLEVRHVTLVAGQLAAALMTLGTSVLTEPAFWSAMVTLVLVGFLNLTVSFYLAFALALKARSVNHLDRQRIRRALVLRLKRSPASFLWPIEASKVSINR